MWDFCVISPGEKLLRAKSRSPRYPKPNKYLLPLWISLHFPKRQRNVSIWSIFHIKLCFPDLFLVSLLHWCKRELIFGAVPLGLPSCLDFLVIPTHSRVTSLASSGLFSARDGKAQSVPSLLADWDCSSEVQRWMGYLPLKYEQSFHQRSVMCL